MRNRSISRVSLVLLLLATLSFSLTFAADKDVVKCQGTIMDLDLKKNVMIVNELQFVWNQSTIIRNEKEDPVPLDRLRIKTWVYVEGINDKAHQRVNAKRIFVLPKYIDAKERHLYPFFE